MKTLNIKSQHRSLSAAVAELNPDLSYNKAVATDYIQNMDRACTQAVVTECGEIYFVFTCDIDVLRKFSPFVSVMDDGMFSVAFITGRLLSIANPTIPKNKAGRNWFRIVGKSMGALAA